MSSELAKINKQIDILQRQLIQQLQTTNMCYIDLNMYVRQLDALKCKKDALYLESIL